MFSAARLGFGRLRFRALPARLAGIGTVVAAEAAAAGLPSLSGLLLRVFTVSELSGIVLVCHYFHLSFDCLVQL
jgi:hypothetical protein